MSIAFLPDEVKRFDVSGEEEVNLRRLATEIGMGILDHEVIFRNHGITREVWDVIVQRPAFRKMLADACELWSSALNTRERVDIKTLAMVEEALPEMWRALHDPRFSDGSKVELFKALQKGAGIGVQGGQTPGAGEKVSITINLGEDKKLTVEHMLPTPITLEGNLVESD